MTKKIFLTTGSIEPGKFSGNAGFMKWFFPPFSIYCRENRVPHDHMTPPLHIVLPIATHDTWQEDILHQLESFKCSILHIEFQNTYFHNDPSDFFIERSKVYRKKVISSLRRHLDNSKWGHVVLSGITRDDCRDVVDVHFQLGDIVYSLIGKQDDHRVPVKTIYQRATVR